MLIRDEALNSAPRVRHSEWLALSNLSEATSVLGACEDEIMDKGGTHGYGTVFHGRRADARTKQYD